VESTVLEVAVAVPVEDGFMVPINAPAAAPATSAAAPVAISPRL
jgi:hypothetical protein